MHDTLQKAVTRVLGPLVRLLLRHGVSHAEFANWAKQAYVTEARDHFGIEGRKPTVSRIAIVTGINRKEVKRVLDLPSEVNTGISKHNRAVRVITGWVQDAQFHDDQGHPRALVYGDPGDSFNTLVRRYGGDVPARALLDELLRVGTVSESDSSIQLQQAGYVPHQSEEALLEVFAVSARDLLVTLDHNLAGEPPRRLQMSVAYDNVTQQGTEHFRRLCADEAMTMLRKLDIELASFDREANPDQTGDGRYRTGVGVYFIEEAVEDDDHQA